MKNKRIQTFSIILIVSLIAIVITALTGIFNPLFTTSFEKNYPTETEYNVLKDYAVNYAKTLDSNTINDSNITVIHSFTEEYLVVTVDNSDRCKIEAQYPLKTEITNDGTFVTTILFEEAVYTEISHVNTVSQSISFLILEFLAITLIISIIILELRDVYYMIKTKKETN